MKRSVCLLAICLLAAAPAAAVTFLWKARFPKTSPPALAAIR
jgi:hypothetical protein